MDTLLLAQDTWDLCLDVNGNLAVAAAPYARAQDVASACRLFAGEAYYDTGRGIPYFDRVLGRVPNAMYLKAQLEQAALTVPGVAQARCLFASFGGRVASGQVQIIDADGVANNVTF